MRALTSCLAVSMRVSDTHSFPVDRPQRLSRLGVLISGVLLDSGLLSPAATNRQAGACYQNPAVDELVAQLQLRLRPPPPEGMLAAAKEVLSGGALRHQATKAVLVR